MSGIDEQRILALDVRPCSFGFVAFEGPREILDWGAKSFRKGVNRVHVPLSLKILRLIDQYVPDMLVIKKPRTKKIEMVMKLIRKQATIQEIPICLLSRNQVTRSFSGGNKHQVATMIVERFPELLVTLPPPRRPWESEDYRMSIFDAGKAGIAYFACKGMHD
jgi:hypothetical protein